MRAIVSIYERVYMIMVECVRDRLEEYSMVADGRAISEAQIHPNPQSEL